MLGKSPWGKAHRIKAFDCVTKADGFGSLHRRDKSRGYLRAIKKGGYIASTGKWETVATVNSAAGLDAEEIAGFIISAINSKKSS